MATAECRSAGRPSPWRGGRWSGLGRPAVAAITTPSAKRRATTVVDAGWSARFAHRRHRRRVWCAPATTRSQDPGRLGGERVGAPRGATGRPSGRSCARTPRRCPPRPRRSRREIVEVRLDLLAALRGRRGVVDHRFFGALVAVSVFFFSSRSAMTFSSGAQSLQQLARVHSRDQRPCVLFSSLEWIHHRDAPKWVGAEVETRESRSPSRPRRAIWRGSAPEQARVPLAAR